MDRETNASYGVVGSLIPKESGPGWLIVRRILSEGFQERILIGEAATVDEGLEKLHKYRKDNSLPLWPYIPRTQYRGMFFKLATQARCRKCQELKALSEFSEARPEFCLDCSANSRFFGKLDTDNGMREKSAKELFAVNEQIALDVLNDKLRAPGVRYPLRLPCTTFTHRVFRDLKHRNELEYCKTFSERGIDADRRFIAKVTRYGYEVAIATLIFGNTLVSTPPDSIDPDASTNTDNG